MSLEKANITSSTTSEEKELAIFQLDPKQQRFIQMYMTGNYSLPKIAELIGIHVNTARKWMKKPEIANALQEAQHEIHKQVEYQLKAMTIKATHKLSDLIDSPIDGVAMQAVKDVLDRGGHKTVNEIKVDKTVTTIEQKWKDLADTLIDVDYEVIDGE